MRILALEVSTARGSLALLNAGQSDFAREWQNDRKNSGPLFEYLDEMRKELEKPDVIIVGLGPGSYAGTRIAISTAIGLQRAFNARLIGYPSICGISCGAREDMVGGDARRQTFFLTRIRDNNLVEGPTLMTEAELAGKLDKIDRTMSIFSVEQLPQFEQVKVRYPSAKLLAHRGGDPKRIFTQPPLEPIYLREPH